MPVPGANGPSKSKWLNRKRVVSLLVSGVLTGIAIALGAPIILDAPTRWPTAEGTVIQAIARFPSGTRAGAVQIEHQVGDKSYEYGDADTDDLLNTCSLQVEYVYEVGGRQYRNWEIDLTGDRLDARSAKVIRELKATRYAPGQKIVVYHHPRNPRRSVLVPVSPRGIKLLWTGFMFLGLFGLTGSLVAKMPD